MSYCVYLTARQNVFMFILIEMLGWWGEIIYLWIKNFEINMRAVHFLEIIYLANILCCKTCMNLQYLICIRIFQKSVLLYFHSFIPLACAERDDSLSFSGASSIPFCYILFPATLLHQLFFHPPSLHLAICFLVYLSILLFPNSYIILFVIFYLLLLLLYTYTVVWLSISPIVSVLLRYMLS